MIPAILPTYARYDLSFERGEGAYLFATNGRKYLDFASGIAVTVLGHSHPHLVAALTEQVKKVWHTSNLFHIAGQERLAERLVANTFADTVFFGNSGAEALECAIKMVRKYHDENGAPEKYRVIACNGSFHGRTLATLAAAGNEKYLKGFGPDVPGFDHVAFGNLNEMRAANGQMQGVAECNPNVVSELELLASATKPAGAPSPAPRPQRSPSATNEEK